MNRSRIVVLIVVALALALSVFGQNESEEAPRLFRQAQELAKAEKFEQAVAVMRKAIRLAPDNDQYLATASDYALKAGQFPDGVELALQAVRLNNKVGAYYVLVAANALGDQNLDLAREYIDIVLKRGPKEFGTSPCNDAWRLRALVGPKTYTLYWNLDPEKGRLVGGKLPIALPKGNLPYQTVTYEVTGVQGHQFVKGEVNDILYVVPQGTRPFSLTTKVTVQPHSFKKEMARATPKPLPPEARACLGPIHLIDPRSPALTKVAAGLKAGNSTDTVRNVLGWMKKNVQYKLQKTSITELDFKSVDEILERGHAECRGQAMVFTALCRAAGVPARPIWGLIRVAPGEDRRYGDIASHNWAEFYVSGCGWVPVDPQWPETLGCLPANHLRIFMDAQKSKTSAEILPMLNLVSMMGDKVKFDESR